MRKTIAVLALMLLCVAVWAKDYALVSPTYQMPRSGAMSKTDVLNGAGAFTDSTLWTRTSSTGATANIPQDGTLVLTAIASGGGYRISDILPSPAYPRVFRVSFYINSLSSGSVQIGVTGSFTYPFAKIGWNTRDFVITSAAGGSRTVFIQGYGASTTATISNLTIRELLP